MSGEYGMCAKCSKNLELCSGVYPWSTDHLICSKCDSTYNIEEVIQDKYVDFDPEREWQSAPNIAPCPFCKSHRIGIIEKPRQKMGTNNKITFCYCYTCGAKGPWGFSDDGTYEVVVQKCIERWNGRG